MLMPTYNLRYTQNVCMQADAKDVQLYIICVNNLYSHLIFKANLNGIQRFQIRRIQNMLNGCVHTFECVLNKFQMLTSRDFDSNILISSSHIIFVCADNTLVDHKLHRLVIINLRIHTTRIYAADSLLIILNSCDKMPLRWQSSPPTAPSTHIMTISLSLFFEAKPISRRTDTKPKLRFHCTSVQS